MGTQVERVRTTEESGLVTSLETERRYYQEIVSSIPIGLLILTPELGIASSNREARQMFGLRTGEVLHGRLPEFMPGEVVDAARAAVETGTPQDDLWVTLPGEPGRTVRLKMRPMRSWNNRPERELLLTVEPAADQPQGEAANTGGFRDAAGSIPAPELLNSVDAILWAVDPGTKQFRYVNETAQEILGFPAEQWLNNPDFWSGRIHPSDREWVLQAYEDAIQQWSRRTIEYRAISSFGRTVWLRESARLLQDSEGQARHLLGIANDITQRRLLERQFVQSQRRDAVSRLAIQVSAQVREQAAVISHYSEQKLAGSGRGPGAKADLQDVIAAAEKLRRLAAQLQSLTGQQAAAPAAVDLTELLSQLAPRMQAALPAGTRFEMNLFPAPIGVWADPEQLTEVLLSLAQAAGGHLHRQGKISIECGPREIEERMPEWETSLNPGVYAVITVADDGEPVDALATAALFEPVLPLPSGEGRGGMDLGRALEVVQHWGGTIVTESVSERGNEFQLYLRRVGERIEVPAKLEPGASAEKAGQAEGGLKAPLASVQAEGQTRTVLVVERDSGIRTLIQKMLQRQGYRVIEANDVAAARALCEQSSGKVDLLIADVASAQAASAQTVEHLRSACPRLRILYLCGNREEAGLTEPHGSGTDWIVKPFTLGALIGKIKEILH